MAAEGIFAGFINGWYYEDPHNTLVSFLVNTLHVYVHFKFKICSSWQDSNSSPKHKEWISSYHSIAHWSIFRFLLSCRNTVDFLRRFGRCCVIPFDDSMTKFCFFSAYFHLFISHWCCCINILILTRWLIWSVADLLDSKARFHWSLAFTKSRHTTLCCLCRDPILGSHRRHFAPFWCLLEALVTLLTYMYICFFVCVCVCVYLDGKAADFHS